MRVYFDHNATTPVDPAVVEVMTRRAPGGLRQRVERPSLRPAGQGRPGRGADGGRGSHRRRAVRGRVHERRHRGRQFRAPRRRRGARDRRDAGTSIASAIEHEAVLNTVKALARRGWTTTLLPVDATGIVAPDGARGGADRRDGARLGDARQQRDRHRCSRSPTSRGIAHARGALFHTDAVQSVAKIPVDVRALGVDLLSLSAHKFNGPKGAGALWIKRGTRRHGDLTGGKHERNRRAGTENVAGHRRPRRGRALARRQADDRGRAPRGAARSAWRTRSWRASRTRPSTARATPRVPNTTNISFEGVEAESLLIALDLEGIAVSTGSACSSGTLEPSHVLRAMGFAAHRTQNSIRFSLGAGNTDEQVDYVLAKLPAVVEKLRALTGARTIS